MKKIFLFTLPLGYLALANPVPVLAQSPVPLRDIDTQISGNNVRIKFQLDTAYSSYAGLQLKYTPLKTGVPTPPPLSQALNSVDSAGSVIAFDVPRTSIGDAEALSYWLEAGSAAAPATYFQSATLRTDLRYLNDLARTSARIAELEAANSTLNTQVIGLQTQIASVNTSTLPNYVSFKSAPVVTENRITVVLETDKFCKVQATLKGPGGWSASETSKQPSQKHILTFKNLAPNLNYKLSAVALKPTDSTPSSVLLPDGPSLDLTTAAAIPTFTCTPALSANANDITVQLNTNSAGYVEAICEEVINPASLTYAFQERRGTLTTNEYDLKVSDEKLISGTNKLTFKSLKPNTTYNFKVNVVSDKGEVLPMIGAAFTTLPAPIPLDFADSMKLTINPLGTKIDWKTTKPATTAKTELVYSDTTTFSLPSNVTGTNVSATLPSTELVTAINKARNIKTPPLIRVSMTNGAETKERILDLVLEMPTKAEVQADTNLSQDQKKQLTEVIEDSAKNKKINWTAILNLGLGLLLKVK